MLYFAYFLAFITLWIQIAFAPWLPLLAFTPFIALASLARPFEIACAASFAAGLTLDLLSSDPLGVHALSYCLAAMLCFQAKRLFSWEAPIQYALFTSLVSTCIILIYFALLFLFDRRVPFRGIWWLTDWIALPIADGVYALIWFAGPIALFQSLRHRWVIFWLKRKNPTLN